MGILDDLSGALQGATDWTMADAILVQAGAKTPNGRGGFTTADAETACRAKIDHKRSYSPERGTYMETRIIIHANGLPAPPVSKNALQFGTGAFNASAPHFILGEVIADGLGSHFSCAVLNG